VTAIAQSSADLSASPLLANLTAAQIAQYAAAHVAQQQQRSSAFSPVQQTDSQAGVQAAASLAVRVPSASTYCHTVRSHPDYAAVALLCTVASNSVGWVVLMGLTSTQRLYSFNRYGLHVSSWQRADIRVWYVEGAIICCSRPWR